MLLYYGKIFNNNIKIYSIDSLHTVYHKLFGILCNVYEVMCLYCMLIYTLHSTQYTCTIQYTLKKQYMKHIQYTLYSIHYTVYTIQYTLYSIHYTVFNIHYTMYIIHCTIENISYSVEA